MMPEEEPANHSEDKVDTKQSISLIFDNIDYILLPFRSVCSLVNALIDILLHNDLQVLRGIPDPCDSA